MKGVCSWIVILILTVLPTLTYAQRSRPGTTPIEETELSIVEQATQDAEYRAKIEADGCLWFGLGYLFTAITVAVAFILSPGPDELSLMGKSPEYVYTYTRVYKQKRHSLQVTYAMLGCGTNVLLYLLMWTIIVNTDDWRCCFSDDWNWDCGYQGCTPDQQPNTE